MDDTRDEETDKNVLISIERDGPGGSYRALFVSVRLIRITNIFLSVAIKRMDSIER